MFKINKKIIILILVLIILVILCFLLTSCGSTAPDPQQVVEVPKQVAQTEEFKSLLNIVQQQKENIEQMKMAAEQHKQTAEQLLKKEQEKQLQEEMKEKKRQEDKQKQAALLKAYKQSKDTVEEILKQKLDKTQYQPILNILSKVEKGDIGIYLIHNKTLDKYYIGQAKQLYKRVQDHFKLNEISLDYHANHHEFEVAIINANELGAAIRIDLAEKSMIEIFSGENKNLYNKTAGNLTN